MTKTLPHLTAPGASPCGAASPDADGETYTVVFAPGPDTTKAWIAFDLLNFDPLDDPAGDLILDEVTLTRRDPADLAGRSLLRRYTFDDGAEGWTSHTAPPFDAPACAAQPGALTVAGAASANAFGFWCAAVDEPAPPATSAASATPRVPTAASAIPPALPRLCIATFEVESSASAETRVQVPQFRVRLDEQSFHASSFLAIESKGDAGRSPVAGERQTYTVFFLPPAGVADEDLIASFDYLNFDPADDATATLKVNEVRVEAVDYPW